MSQHITQYTLKGQVSNALHSPSHTQLFILVVWLRIALTFAPESSRLMVRLAGQELLVMAMAGPFIPGPVYTSRWLLDRGSWGGRTHTQTHMHTTNINIRKQPVLTLRLFSTMIALDNCSSSLWNPWRHKECEKAFVLYKVIFVSSDTTPEG